MSNKWFTSWIPSQDLLVQFNCKQDNQTVESMNEMMEELRAVAAKHGFKPDMYGYDKDFAKSYEKARLQRKIDFINGMG